jgi:hypothetical protein
MTIKTLSQKFNTCILYLTLLSSVAAAAPRSVAAAGQSPSSGIGLATFLLGDVTNFGRYVSTSTNAQESQRRLFWYGQDTWRPTAKLTTPW